MTKRHKVFVSYHHANDQAYRQEFERICDSVMVSRSVDVGDIDLNLNTDYIRQSIRDRFLADTSITVVLIGKQTWQRKHVDWEISASIRDTSHSPRSGLMGILLPIYPRPSPGKYSSNTVPPRLWDNIEGEYAKMYPWTDDPNEIQEWIHDAYLVKGRVNPINSRPLFGKNRIGDSWQE